jgi:hypothetical protein
MRRRDRAEGRFAEPPHRTRAPGLCRGSFLAAPQIILLRSFCPQGHPLNQRPRQGSATLPLSVAGASSFASANVAATGLLLQDTRL